MGHAGSILWTAKSRQLGTNWPIKKLFTTIHNVRTCAQMGAKQRSQFYPALDILRCFAATTIVMYHVIEYTQWSSFPKWWPLAWYRYGWMGVDIFFVLSGFVIALAAMRGYRESTQKGAFRKNFMLARVARIVPLHYLTCVMYAVLYNRALWDDKRVAATHFSSHALFLHNLSPKTLGSINGVNWSLAVEMQMYALILLCAGWLSRAKPQTVLACSIPIAWGSRALAFRWGDGQPPAPVLMTWYYTTNVFGNMDFFGVGAALAVAASSKSDSTLARLWRRPLRCLALGACTLVAACAILSLQAGKYWELWPMVVFFRTLSALAWGLIIAAFCGINKPNPLVKPLMYGGKISYGIYLMHMMVMLELQKRNLWVKPALSAALALLLSAAASSLSWHFFEEPCLKLARRFVSTQSGKSANAADGLPIMVASGSHVIKAHRAA